MPNVSTIAIGSYKWDAVVLSGDEVDTWTDQTATSEAWTLQSPTSETWTEQSETAEVWTVLNKTTQAWTEQARR